MKHIIYSISIALLTAFCLSSCDSFFDVDLNDQATLEEQFSKYNTAKRFLAHCYSYLPYEEKLDALDGGVVRCSDESMFGFTSSASASVYWLKRTGDYSPASFVANAFGQGHTLRQNGNFWDYYYQAIRQCTIFMDNIGLCQESGVTQELRDYMTAEARFLRAYYYFCLFRYYGPVIIWGEEQAPDDVNGATLDRNTVDENISFIVDQLDKAIAVLPNTVGEVGGLVSVTSDTGRATKGAAMALKARVLLYAASPLYNAGGENGKNIYAGMTNHYGDPVFPQEYDAEKWTKAAKAAKDVIDLQMYSLVEAKEKNFEGYANAYRNIYDSQWNNETIWGWWYRTYEPGNDFLGSVGAGYPYYLPSNFGFSRAYCWVLPSLRLVDAYPMYESGRYPLDYSQGMYEKDADGLNLSRPYIDPDSGYENEGFVEDWKAPHMSWAPGVKAHKSTTGRDPRYYVTLVPNGHYWPNKDMNKILTMYQSKEATSPYSPGTACNVVGYVYARLLPTDNALKEDAAYKTVKFVYPAFRMSEVYLNYAEALNEQPQRDGAGACAALNKVRNRVGLNNIEEAYPGIESNKELLRWCIQQERMCEFAMEGYRWYDAGRWMTSAEEFPCGNWTLNLGATTYEESYERTNTLHPYANKPAVFSDKDYLFPMSTDEISEMVNYTQNYGF